MDDASRASFSKSEKSFGCGVSYFPPFWRGLGGVKRDELLSVYILSYLELYCCFSTCCCKYNSRLGEECH